MPHSKYGTPALAPKHEAVKMRDGGTNAKTLSVSTKRNGCAVVASLLPASSSRLGRQLQPLFLASPELPANPPG